MDLSEREREREREREKRREEKRTKRLWRAGKREKLREGVEREREVGTQNFITHARPDLKPATMAYNMETHNSKTNRMITPKGTRRW